jgi:aminopeptidase
VTADPTRCAALLCDWCLEVAPGQQVLVSSTSLAEPLLDALHAAILDHDAWPIMRMSSPAWGPDFYAHARPRHLDGVASAERIEAETVDAFLGIDAPRNAAALADVDPARIARVAVARSPLREIRGAARWAVTLWPTPALAQLAGMSEASYAAFVERALFLDRDDPVAAWMALSMRQAELVARLTPAPGSGSRRRAPISHCRSPGAPGSTPTAGATCPAARSSPARTRPRPTARSPSRSRPGREG